MWVGLSLGFVVESLRPDFEGRPAGAAHSSLGPSETAGAPQLLLFLHPRCPCSRAALADLARLLTHAPAELAATAWFFQPADAPPAWLEGDILDQARGISRLEIRIDVGGALAARLGVETSGEALLYDADGQLLFDGGLTSARGHQGLSQGQLALLDAFVGDAPRVRTTPVFGCGLLTANGSGQP